METVRLCKDCGVALADDAPEGLCPKCLVKVGLGSETDGPTKAARKRKAAGFVPPEPDELGKLFPQLEILELLGQGGMGVVYQARQPQLDRLVALKILPPESGRDPAFAERFTREARALARLCHPNIVAVHDFGQSGDFYYFIMEFVDGLNLRQLEQSRRLTPQEALSIVPKICEALQFAHDEGIVHRDIKPGNILIDKRGRVKIADFGLAKLLGKQQADFALTGSQQVMGTPHYMAPEQMEKPQTVDHRADIYSLGVVFYEMLTGELPIGRFASPSQKVQIDVRLDEVVLKSLAREPERRYQHASEVKTDVEAISLPGALANHPRRTASASSDTVSRPKEQDFLICNPALPKMAKAICFYALVVAPVIRLANFFSLVTDQELMRALERVLDFDASPEGFSKLTEAQAINMRYTISRVLDFSVTTLVDLSTTAFLFIAGLKLRALKRSALGFIQAALGLGLLSVLVLIGVSSWLEPAGSPTGPVLGARSNDLWLFLLEFISLVFTVVAFVWVLRHRDVLRTCLSPKTTSELKSAHSAEHRGSQAAREVKTEADTIATTTTVVASSKDPLLTDSGRILRRVLIPAIGLLVAGVVAYLVLTRPPDPMAWRYAAEKGDVQAIEKLLRRGMDLNAKPYDGTTALIRACSYGHHALAQLLLEKGANVNEKGNDLQTALMKASSRGDVSLTSLLTLFGANLNEQDNEGRTALMLAAENGHASVIKALLDLESIGITSTSDEDFREKIRELGGVDPALLQRAGIHARKFALARDARDHDGDTALTKAATRGATDCVKQLEDWSDASLRDHRGRTAAMHAVVNGQKAFLQEMAEVFEGPLPAVNVGVWVHPLLAADTLRITDNEGKTALQLADEQKQAEIAALLRGYLGKVIDKETQVIAKSGVADANYIPRNYLPVHYRYRAFAFQARGDSAEAAADLEEAERLELQKKP